MSTLHLELSPRASVCLENLTPKALPSRTLGPSRPGPACRLGDWACRARDVAVAGAAMIVLAPLFGILALAVRLETRGPVFFKQRRVGRGGRPFWMVKFRSMHLDAEARRQAVREAAGAAGDLRFKMRGDPRITRVGRILRRLSLDELPQLLNVLRGEMSLVGPRPPIPEETARYSRHEWGRMAVTPGLTCLWQVRGRSDIPFDGQVELDLEYIKNRSFLRDLGILLQTIPAVLSGRGAY